MEHWTPQSETEQVLASAYEANAQMNRKLAEEWVGSAEESPAPPVEAVERPLAGLGWHILDEEPTFIVDGRDISIATTFSYRVPELSEDQARLIARANAHFIAAAGNACADVPTSVLGPGSFREMLGILQEVQTRFQEGNPIRKRIDRVLAACGANMVAALTLPELQNFTRLLPEYKEESNATPAGGALEEGTV